MITRFAPSPTGPLHLGHAYAACVAWDLAQAAGGTFLLRIEDIDRSRARPDWEAQITEDLHWLGFTWPTPVMRQSDRQAAYDAALDLLWDQGLLYPCACNRRDIAAAASAPQEGAAMGPDGIIYPGTCRHVSRRGPRPGDKAIRLDMKKATQALEIMTYRDNDKPVVVNPQTMVDDIGDVVLARRDMGTSYHLAVVVDDAAQGITLVTRGADLSSATPIHILLQNLLGLPVPAYHHHRLIRDDAGKRLAKRDDARALSLYRREGVTPADLRALIGLS